MDEFFALMKMPIGEVKLWIVLICVAITVIVFG